MDKYAVMTYHPTTTENDMLEKQIDGVIQAMINSPDIMFICTKANADVGGKKLI